MPQRSKLERGHTQGIEMNLIDDPSDGLNAPEFSVSDISTAVKRLIEGEFSYVKIRGEVGRVSRPRSGHVYLDLKDDRSVISGILWKGVASHMQTQPEEGMEVVATGRLTTFPGQSKYQIIIEDIQPAGVGALMALLEKRKILFQAEGLFKTERKKALPYLPDVIGVITSPSGAVIRDILHRLRDRFPRKVLIWPVAVQGGKCAPEVARGIAGFNALPLDGAMPRPNLLIVARGGGSVEDLWGFNEEIVVRAAAASIIPLISAVGHETDTTLIDFVSDKRAPTPTAAAELAVPVRHELLAWTEDVGARMISALSGCLQSRGQRLSDLGRALLRKVRLANIGGSLKPIVLMRQMEKDLQRLEASNARLDLSLGLITKSKREHLEVRINRLKLYKLTEKKDLANQQLKILIERLQFAIIRQFELRRQQIETVGRLCETLSYKATLSRGYAVVRGGGKILTTQSEVKSAKDLEIELSDGKFSLPGVRSGRKTNSETAEQGSLF
jgi:exodeoxyribonuclease VII large subunit